MICMQIGKIMIEGFFIGAIRIFLFLCFRCRGNITFLPESLLIDKKKEGIFLRYIYNKSYYIIRGSRIGSGKLLGKGIKTGVVNAKGVTPRKLNC